MDAYLDIETNGLSPFRDRLTVIGIGFEAAPRITQLVCDEITASNLQKALGRCRRIFTYNGARFDLPFIRVQLGLDLEHHFVHHDLMWDCHACGLRGGLKAVETRLGIQRKLPGMTGRDAVYLWRKYITENDSQSLKLLLAYNREDVRNLKTLRRRLAEILPRICFDSLGSNRVS